MGPSPPPRPPGLLRHPSWDPALAAGLEAMIARHGTDRPLAVLDWDETVIRGDISEFLLGLVAERTGEPLVEQYARACAEDLLRAYVDLVDTLCAGRTEPECRALALGAFDEGVRRGEIAARESMRELVWALHRHGWEVWVVTASAEVLVQAIADRVGVHPNRVVGMRLAVGADGRYVPGVLPPVTWREGKVDAVARACGRGPTFVAGDSRGDLPMLRSARFRLVVDRGDEAVRAEAAAGGWWTTPAGGLR